MESSNLKYAGRREKKILMKKGRKSVYWEGEKRPLTVRDDHARRITCFISDILRKKKELARKDSGIEEIARRKKGGKHEVSFEHVSLRGVARGGAGLRGHISRYVKGKMVG